MGLPFIFGKKKTEETPDITNEELERILKSAPVISPNTIKSEVDGIDVCPSNKYFNSLVNGLSFNSSLSKTSRS